MLPNYFLPFKKYLLRFEEALNAPITKDRISIDAAIQRFEFTFELCWKNLKKSLEKEGYIVKTPKESLIKAYQIGWINNEDVWLQMLNDRNLTSHTYNESQADTIYANFPKYLENLKELYSILEEKHT